jgi:hypothetical protein
MSWTVIFLILGIAAAVLGIWNLAQGRRFFIAIIGVVLLLQVLISFYFGQINIVILPGLSLSNLLGFLILPILLILSFFGRRNHR